MNCTDNDLYKSLEHCNGTPVLTGIRPVMYFIKKSNIVAWPVRPSTAKAAVGEIATYNTAFTLAADKKFMKMDLNDLKNNFEAEAQGERPSRTFNNKLTVVLPGENADTAATVGLLINDSVIIIFFDRSGAARILGNEMYDVQANPSVKTGTSATDEHSTTIEFSVPDTQPAPYYAADIVCESGTINGATGAVKTTTVTP